jgi:MOSC domain-containing protein YiiM
LRVSRGGRVWRVLRGGRVSRGVPITPINPIPTKIFINKIKIDETDEDVHINC